GEVSEGWVGEEKVVGERGKGDAADIGPCERWIEHIRIFGQPNPQRRLGRRQPAGECDVCSRCCGPTHDFHSSPSRSYHRPDAPARPSDLSVSTLLAAQTSDLRVNSDISRSSRGPDASCPVSPIIADNSLQRWQAVACPV